jgi:hypothetical protein
MVLCSGCGGSFRFGAGYINHIRLSRNEDCAAIYQQSILYQDLDYDNDDQGGQISDFEDSMFEGDDNVIDYEWPMQDVVAEQPNEDEGWEEKIDNPASGKDEIEAEAEKSDEESGSDEEEFDDQYEECWEPPPQVYTSEMDFEDEPEDDIGLSQEARLAAEDAFRKHPVIEKYPDSRAGAPVSHDRVASKNESYAKSINNEHNPWAPFASQIDWEIAQWAKLRGPGSTAMSDLLKIDGVNIVFCFIISLIFISYLKVVEKLGLSYHNSQALHAIIDNKLPNRPKFHRSEVVIAGEAFEIYSRNIVDCIKSLFGDPEFTSQLILSPERHYADADRTQRLYHEMNTGKWWWNTQVNIIIFDVEVVLTFHIENCG